MRGEAPRAKGLLERALAMEPRNAVTLVRLGDTELELGNTAEARARFEQALRDRAQSAAAIDGMGKVAAGDRRHRARDRDVTARARAPAGRHQPPLLAVAGLPASRQVEEAQYHLARRGEATVVLDDPVLDADREDRQSVHLQLAQANRAMEDRRYDAAADAFRQRDRARTRRPHRASWSRGRALRAG